jgi:hypothetical protein
MGLPAEENRRVDEETPSSSGWRFLFIDFPPLAGGARGGGNKMKQRKITFIHIVSAVLMLLPLSAFAETDASKATV